MRDEFGFDLLALARASFVNHLQIIREAHDAALEALNRQPKAYTRASPPGSAPLSEEEESHLKEIERRRAEDQRRAFGQAWLMYLASILEAELNAVNKLFDQAAPSCGGRGKAGRRTKRGQGMQKWSDNILSGSRSISGPTRGTTFWTNW